jgi:hypothetical protein
LQFKPIVLSICCFSLIGCDQVRDRLVNGFDWDRKISSINNNELTPQKPNQDSNNAINPLPSSSGKPLDNAPISPARIDGAMGQHLITKKPKKVAPNAPDVADGSSVETTGSLDVKAVAVPKPVRRSSYKNVSGMSENDW